MPRGERRQHCARCGKQIFDNRIDAEMAAARARNFQDRSTKTRREIIGAYFDPECQKFHMGHTPLRLMHTVHHAPPARFGPRRLNGGGKGKCHALAKRRARERDEERLAETNEEE